MLTHAERKATKKGHRLRSAQQKLHHNGLHLILKELIDLQSDDKENGTGVAVNVASMGEVFLHFEVCFIIRDTLGHDALCCQYQAYSREALRPVRSCTAKWIDLDLLNPTCPFVTKEYIYGIVEECMYHIEHGIQRPENPCSGEST
eukprot:14488327-Ditylum_brightwellii.AAC.1